MVDRRCSPASADDVWLARRRRRRRSSSSLQLASDEVVSSNAKINRFSLSHLDREEGGNSRWECHSVVLHRVPAFGFGIAISGGRDNPHFRSGDPSIAISDVVKGGPAWGLLCINDRILVVNGVTVDNVDYNTAVQIMRDSDQLNMIVKRRVPIPHLELDQRTLKFTLTKSRRKEDFGLVLGCKFYIKDITNPKLAEKEPGLKENDTVLEVNGQSLTGLTLQEANKLLLKNRERLKLIIRRDVPRGSTWRWGSQQSVYERLGGGSLVGETPRDSPRASPRPPPPPQRFPSEDLLAANQLPPHPLPNGDSRHQQQQQYRNLRPSYQQMIEPSASNSQQQTDNNGFVAVNSGYESNLAGGSGDYGSIAGGCNNSGSTAAESVRRVNFHKEGGSVGVRVVGGNEVGIFVSAVQAGSPAAAKGVRPGDKLLQVNGKDMVGVTREEAVLYLLGLQEQVDLRLQYRRDEYERVRSQNLGDNFYIRVHFDKEQSAGEAGESELSFKKGDVLQVTDTLYGGTVGSWQATKLTSPSAAIQGQSLNKGIIPNASRAEKAAESQEGSAKSGTIERKSTFFRRRKIVNLSGSATATTTARRTKSLTKNNWDEVVFGRPSPRRFPAYERVRLKQPGFLRPVVLFGPLADLSRELLLRDFPLRFASPSAATGEAPSAGIIKLSAIREIINKNKHCLLDVTPSSVEKLQYAQYSPIVIYVGVESRSRFKELRMRHPGLKATNSSISTRKLMEQGHKLQKHFAHLITATLDATAEDAWFEALRRLIGHLQERRVWMPEAQPADLLEDDLLFPMANAYRCSNYDSDGDSLKGDCGSEVGGAMGTRLSNPVNSLPAENPLMTGSCYENGPAGSAAVAYGPAAFYRHYGSPYDRAPVQLPPVYYDSYHRNVAMPATSVRVGADQQQQQPIYFYSPFGAEVYQNRDALVSHFATLRRPAKRPVEQFVGGTYRRQKKAQVPVPPHGERTPNRSPLKSETLEKSDREESEKGQNDQQTNGLRRPNQDEQRQQLVENNGEETCCSAAEGPAVCAPVGGNAVASKKDLADVGAAGCSKVDSIGVVEDRRSSTLSSENTGDAVGIVGPSPYRPSPHSQRLPYHRHYSEPGYYDVKQILAEQNDDYNTLKRSSPILEEGQSGFSHVGRHFESAGWSHNDPLYGAKMGRQRSPQFGGYADATSPRARLLPAAPSVTASSSASPPPPSATSWAAVSPVERMNEPRCSTGEEKVPPPPAPKIESRLPPPIGSPSRSPTYVGSEKPATAAKPKIPQKPTVIPQQKSPPLSIDLDRQKGMSAFEKYERSTTDRDEQALIENNNEPNSTTVKRTKSETESSAQEAALDDVGYESGVFDSAGGVLNSLETGVSLIIPPGALPPNKHQLIYFKVCRDTENSGTTGEEQADTLLSPLVMCGPQGVKFDTSVELRLPHSADTSGSPDQWSFALKTAPTSADEDGQSPRWKQVSIATSAEGGDEQQVTRFDKDFVSVKIDHF